ncbi:MAG: hypothetical protein NW206_11665 [Hyphomonadaceae bacterium]|nr:hypothetical protein [Hyphomonadaceae bacterium]
MLRWLLSIGIFGGMIALCIVGWSIGGVGGVIGGALGAFWGLLGRGYDAGERLGNVYTGALVGMPIGLLIGGGWAVGLPYIMAVYSGG